ncbi:hypothetical protein MIMGU_mgv11b017020mg [Erythranthe guttata]|uniref:Uncharacterized protein n=1 Tax=Erythranthe guttata TaxID=4155 RepID=A0A022RB31_ERYGU|nr:hypothetical protein MIMGU_mgv11b017020mg [Erythranthe guttata]
MQMRAACISSRLMNPFRIGTPAAIPPKMLPCVCLCTREDQSAIRSSKCGISQACISKLIDFFFFAICLCTLVYILI